MYIGKCLDADRVSKINEDPMEELGNILHGQVPVMPAEVLEEARAQMINEIMTKSQETMEYFNKLKSQEAANKAN